MAMMRRLLFDGRAWALAFALSLVMAQHAAAAAPRINNLSLRGLQAGGVTTLVIEGSELLPDPRIFFSAPVARQAIKDGAKPERLEVEIALDGQTPSGIYLLRVASASGISRGRRPGRRQPAADSIRGRNLRRRTWR